MFEAGTVDVDAFELLAAQGRPRGPQPKRYVEMATWLYDRLKPAPGSVPVGEIVEAAGEEGFLGTLDKAGKRWSNFKLLYRGAGRVPKLAAPRDGHQVVQYVIEHEGKKLRRLRLIPIGSVPPPQPGATPDQVTVEIIDERGTRRRTRRPDDLAPRVRTSHVRARGGTHGNSSTRPVLVAQGLKYDPELVPGRETRPGSGAAG